MGLELPGARLIPLADAGAVICELLPDLARLARPTAAVDADSILSAAKAAGAAIEATPMPGWESIPDAELYQRLARGWPSDTTDPVVAVPWDSFASSPLTGYAVECPQNQLRAVIEGYCDRAVSAFFDGDTIFVCAAQRVILILHHGGDGYGFVVRDIPKVP